MSALSPSARRLSLPFADVVLGRQSPLWSLVSRDVGVTAMRLCWPLMCESPHGLISTPVFYVSGSVSTVCSVRGVTRHAGAAASSSSLRPLTRAVSIRSAVRFVLTQPMPLRPRW